MNYANFEVDSCEFCISLAIFNKTNFLILGRLNDAAKSTQSHVETLAGNVQYSREAPFVQKAMALDFTRRRKKYPSGLLATGHVHETETAGTEVKTRSLPVLSTKKKVSKTSQYLKATI